MILYICDMCESSCGCKIAYDIKVTRCPENIFRFQVIRLLGSDWTIYLRKLYKKIWKCLKNRTVMNSQTKVLRGLKESAISSSNLCMFSI